MLCCRTVYCIVLLSCVVLLCCVVWWFYCNCVVLFFCGFVIFLCCGYVILLFFCYVIVLCGVAWAMLKLFYICEELGFVKNTSNIDNLHVGADSSICNLWQSSDRTKIE